MSGGDRPGAPDDGGTGNARDGARAGRVAVVGPGAVGLSVAAALSGADRAVAVVGRRPERPAFLQAHPDVGYRAAAPAEEERGAAADAEGGRPGDVPGDPDGPSTLIFCVPDDALRDAAADWARALASRRRASPSGGSAGGEEAPVALHTSGVHGADVLAPLRDVGRAVASWHPLTALSGPRADAFVGVTFAVEGDSAAARRARALAGAVGGRPIRLEPGASARYHASAVFASNYLVACLAVAARELAAATGGDGSLDDLLPLARAAVDNLSGQDPGEGATGPIARGDAGTVRRHLEALDPESAGLYRRLARELLDVVEGRLEERTAEELRRILEDPVDGGVGPGG